MEEDGLATDHDLQHNIVQYVSGFIFQCKQFVLNGSSDDPAYCYESLYYYPSLVSSGI